ncbi:hypothetical protein ACFL6C_08875 [Myxococcota bacterium]
MAAPHPTGPTSAQALAASVRRYDRASHHGSDRPQVSDDGAAVAAAKQRLRIKLVPGKSATYYDDLAETIMQDIRRLERWDEKQLIEKLEMHGYAIQDEQHVVARGPNWWLDDTGSLHIDAPSTKAATAALVSGLRAYLKTELAQEIAAWAGCGRKCRWSIKQVGAKTDKGGEILRVNIRASLTDSFGDHRGGHRNWESSFADIHREGRRWRLELNAFTLFTSM